MGDKLFNTRVQVYQALGIVNDYADLVLDAWKGVGGSRLDKLRRIQTGARFIRNIISPWGAKGMRTVTSGMLKYLATSLFELAEGWQTIDGLHLWVQWTESGTVDEIRCVGGNDALRVLVRNHLHRIMPHALYATETQVGVSMPSLKPDRERNVRPLTHRDRALCSRLAGYVATKTHASVLLYGPPGSAKTTAACSIAHELVGSYFRLHASRLNDDAIETLCDLAPKAVIIDDLHTVTDPAVLHFLERLDDSETLVFGTANDYEDLDPAMIRTCRFDIHEKVDGLDEESFAEIVRDVGLQGVDLGPDAAALLSSDLVVLGRRHRAGDLPDPHAAVAELLQRREQTAGNRSRLVHAPSRERGRDLGSMMVKLPAGSRVGTVSRW